jgi:aspartyl-tRNA(Asn)/glutamyl-tRNA(Gln) amidotransferase subunit C
MRAVANLLPSLLPDLPRIFIAPRAQTAPTNQTQRRASVSSSSSIMSFTHADVSRIAQLARIALTDDEKTATAAQLNGIFALIETMRAVDTKGVEPLTTPLAAISDFHLRLRDDAVTESDRRDDYQKSAPSIEDGLYLVPKVIE